MTPYRAEKILKKASWFVDGSNFSEGVYIEAPRVDWKRGAKEVTLDGSFTAAQIEAILVLMRTTVQTDAAT